MSAILSRGLLLVIVLGPIFCVTEKKFWLVAAISKQECRLQLSSPINFVMSSNQQFA